MRVVLSGGGSGGHIYPALAIAEGLKAWQPRVELLYIGTQHGLERELVPRAGVPFRTIHARGLLVRGVKGKVAGAVSAAKGLGEALGILREFRPDVVVGTGGYVSGPVGLAASWLKVPLVIQEQNAWPGFTNRELAKRAYAVFVPYDEARARFPRGTHVIIAGNPIKVPPTIVSRSTARHALGLDEHLRVVMATGGSQGAEAINALMSRILRACQDDGRIGVLWATGPRYYQAVIAELQRLLPDGWDAARIRVEPYFYQIQQMYQASDLYVGRAGAMTLTDCAAFGLPAVLIPSPHVSEDHQTKNARAVERRGAAVVMTEAEALAHPEEVLALLRDDMRLERMAEAMHALFDATALDRIVETVRRAAEERRRSWR
ncbi:MAG: undecaprenyldiphospho-muramoylpentapeptide beta-N-acetylglucosaminyltransferase [Firmicutes bacterium]|nr:undecaprenyldiphospho-muramoylpentapeptide beta-N-acetylglucosaminyltransferase [Bacillota bacterium]